MKRLWLTASIAAVGVLAAAAITTWAQTAEPSSDPLFRAMRDEIERSKKLSIPGLESPYFIEYSIDEQESFTVSASLGGLLSQCRERFRSPDVHVRVGDYKFDNSNFAGGGGGGSRYDLERFPVEESYALIRRYLWLETDSVYKGAVEALSRKRAALRNITQTDQLNDFAHAEAVHYIHDFKPLVVDETAWAGRVRSLSAIFAQFPEVKASTVDLEVTEGGHYLENSEGTEIKVPESVTVLKIRAAAQAPDGTTVRDFAFVHALDVKNMPGDAELTRTATSVAQNVAALAHAGKGEDYNGPVLFEGAAGAQLFAEVLGKNLVVSRRAEGGRGGRAPAGELEGRIGVYSDFYSVTSQSLRFTGKGLAVVKLSPHMTLKAGVWYINRVNIKLLPAGGLVWTPNPDIYFDILFPNPKVAKRLTTWGNTEWWLYGRGEYGGGAWTVRRNSDIYNGNPPYNYPSMSHDLFEYDDIRIAVGLDFKTLRQLNGYFEVGLACSRQLSYASGLPSNYYPNNTVFIGAGLSY